MTAPQGSFLTPALREDVLVSVCFGDVFPDPATFDTVAALAKALDARFRFREIVVVAEESQQEAFLPLVRHVENLRLITVRDGTVFYRRRAIAADEAIGDVVVLANTTEIDYLDIVSMMERAADEQRGVLSTRVAGTLDRALSAPLIILGRMAGFKVSLRDLQTLALPRTLLNQLLAHPDPDLALRFPPRDVRVPLAFAEAAPDMPSRRRIGGQRQRLALVQKLLVYVAPKLLMMVTLTSALLVLLGFFFLFYVLGAWIVIDDLAPGWLTLSAMLSLTALFLGVSIMGLSLGLQQLLSRTHRDDFDAVTSEVNRIDLFGKVASELNVDIESDEANATGSAPR